MIRINTLSESETKSTYERIGNIIIKTTGDIITDIMIPDDFNGLYSVKQKWFRDEDVKTEYVFGTDDSVYVMYNSKHNSIFVNTQGKTRIYNNFDGFKVLKNIPIIKLTENVFVFFDEHFDNTFAFNKYEIIPNTNIIKFIKLNPMYDVDVCAMIWFVDCDECKIIKEYIGTETFYAKDGTIYKKIVCSNKSSICDSNGNIILKDKDGNDAFFDYIYDHDLRFKSLRAEHDDDENEKTERSLKVLMAYDKDCTRFEVYKFDSDAILVDIDKDLYTSCNYDNFSPSTRYDSFFNRIFLVTKDGRINFLDSDCNLISKTPFRVESVKNERVYDILCRFENDKVNILHPDVVDFAFKKDIDDYYLPLYDGNGNYMPYIFVKQEGKYNLCPFYRDGRLGRLIVGDELCLKEWGDEIFKKIDKEDKEEGNNIRKCGDVYCIKYKDGKSKLFSRLFRAQDADMIYLRNNIMILENYKNGGKCAVFIIERPFFGDIIIKSQIEDVDNIYYATTPILVIKKNGKFKPISIYTKKDLTNDWYDDAVVVNRGKDHPFDYDAICSVNGKTVTLTF